MFRPDQKKQAEKRIKRGLKKFNKKYTSAIRGLSKPPLAILKKKLWDAFSAYIRQRDSANGWFICISCGTPQSTQEGNLHAGHYHKSSMSMALRYDEKNVNGQCYHCNIRLEGNRQGYEKGLIKKYGPAVIQDFDIRKNNKVKWTRFEYELHIKIYTDKIKTL